MINKHSAHLDEAARFLDWALSAEAQQKQLSMGIPYPSNVNVDLSHLPSVSQQLGQLIAAHSTATFMHIDHALSPGFSNPFLDFLQAVLVGAMSPREAAAQIETIAEGIDETSEQQQPANPRTMEPFADMKLQDPDQCCSRK